MIQTQTYLNVADNSGAKKIMCIRVLGGGNRRYGFIGDRIIAVVKDAIPNMAVKKSDVIEAVIVRTRHSIRRDSGMTIRFDDNAAVIINKDCNPRGTRVLDQLPANYVKRASPKLFLWLRRYCNGKPQGKAESIL